MLYQGHYQKCQTTPSLKKIEHPIAAQNESMEQVHWIVSNIVLLQRIKQWIKLSPNNKHYSLVFLLESFDSISNVMLYGPPIAGLESFLIQSQALITVTLPWNMTGGDEGHQVLLHSKVLLWLPMPSIERLATRKTGTRINISVTLWKCYSKNKTQQTLF